MPKTNQLYFPEKSNLHCKTITSSIVMYDAGKHFRNLGTSKQLSQGFDLVPCLVSYLHAVGKYSIPKHLTQ